MSMLDVVRPNAPEVEVGASSELGEDVTADSTFDDAKESTNVLKVLIAALGSELNGAVDNSVDGPKEDTGALDALVVFGFKLDGPVVNLFEGANEDTDVLTVLVTAFGSTLVGAVDNLFDDVGAEMQPAGV